MKNTMSMFAILGAAMLSACASKNGGGAAVQKLEIADKLNKLPAGTSFVSSATITGGTFELVKEGEKWQYKLKQPGKTLLFAADDFMKDGDFDVSKSAKLEDIGEVFRFKLKVARNNLTYANYGMLEKTIDGSAIKDYDFFFAGIQDKHLPYEKNTAKATKFSGKTYAVRKDLSNDSEKNLTGTANLTIGANATKGDLTFKYDGWETITGKDFDLSNGQVSSWESTGGLEASPIQVDHELKTELFNNDELVGTYKVRVSNTATGYDVKGVFGMKGKVQD